MCNGDPLRLLSVISPSLDIKNHSPAFIHRSSCDFDIQFHCMSWLHFNFINAVLFFIRLGDLDLHIWRVSRVEYDICTHMQFHCFTSNI